MTIKAACVAWLAIAGAGCVAPRVERGHIDIRASHPETFFEKSHLDLHVEDRRIVYTSPNDGTVAEAWLTDDDCVHVMSRGRSIAFCPLPGEPNKFSGALGLGFAVELRQAKSILRVTLDGQYADLALAHDAVGDEAK